jgi:hypothetical protein
VLEKFITKEVLPTIVISFVLVITVIFQSKYFATQLDLANVRQEVLQLKIEMQQYSDNADKEILKDLDIKYNTILTKLDKLK